MKYLLTLLLLPSVALADFKLVELNQVALDYRNYGMLNDKARNLLIYPEHPKEAINVIVNIDLLKFAYWNSTIESLTTPSQYKSIGLDTRLGLRVSNFLELGIWHHSQHVLDGTQSYMSKFPSEDAVQVKLFLYRKEKQDSIF